MPPDETPNPPPQTLLILVNSNRNFEAVGQLAAAATGRGKDVQVHLMDEGLELVVSKAFLSLCRTAKVTLCAAGIVKNARQFPTSLPDGVDIVPPSQLAGRLDRCQRNVVF